MNRERLEEEFERIVRILSEGRGNKYLRNRLYDVASMLERAQREEIWVEAI